MYVCQLSAFFSIRKVAKRKHNVELIQKAQCTFNYFYADG